MYCLYMNWMAIVQDNADRIKSRAYSIWIPFVSSNSPLRASFRWVVRLLLPSLCCQSNQFQIPNRTERENTINQLKTDGRDNKVRPKNKHRCLDNVRAPWGRTHAFPMNTNALAGKTLARWLPVIRKLSRSVLVRSSAQANRCSAWTWLHCVWCGKVGHATNTHFEFASAWGVSGVCGKFGV